MRLLRFLLIRVFAGALVVVAVTIIVFALVFVAPGDPARAYVGLLATPEQVAEAKEALGLDKPLPVQYVRWLGRVAEGDFGKSIGLRRDIGPVLAERFANTAILAAASFVLALVVGLAVGIMSAAKRGSLLDRVLTLLSLSGASVPPFWLGLLLVFVFSISWSLLPTSGMHDVRGGGFIDLLRHLVLPAITASLGPMAVIARISRSRLMTVLTEDYVMVARAKGLRRRRVIYVHAVRNILPIVTSVAGLQMGYLLSGTVFAEVVFAWPGVGQLLFSAILDRDLPVIQGTVFVLSLSFVVINMLTDIISMSLDPRAREV